MMRVNVLLFGLLIITSCDQFYEYAITYESESDNTINYRDELLTVRYVACKQCDVGGTLNQVSIRNNSAEPLQIDSLSLSMFIDEIDVIAADSPIVYSADAIASDARVIPFEGIIPSTEWRYFAFPIADCTLVDRNSEAVIEFTISASSASREYENIARISKRAARSPMAWP